VRGARTLRISSLVALAFAIGAPVAYGATATSNAGILSIGDGTGNEVNHVSVYVPGASTYRVFDTAGMTAQSGCVTVDATSLNCDPFGVQQVAAFLHGQADTFASNLLLPAFVAGGDGNDTLGGGPVNDQMEGDLGNDALYGDDGNDSLTDGDAGGGLYGAGGDDQLYGENGNDHLDGGVPADNGAGGDVLDGGAQTDTLTYAPRTQPLKVTEDGNANDGQTGEGDNVTAVEHIILGSAGDQATGDGSPNTLEGRNGNDSLNGGAGNDQLLGQNGNDTLAGAGGADTLSGGAGLDKADYSASAARVTVTIGNGADDGSAGEKDNVLDDVEIVLGSSRGDVLTGEDGANALSGGAGADQLSGLGGDDTLNGGTGADQLTGGSGDEAINGGPNPDQISGGSGDDSIDAKDGAKDTIGCGTGKDRVTVDAIDVVSSNCEQVTG
jgi:Ca2+-binding RTX toxin-like protein